MESDSIKKALQELKDDYGAVRDRASDIGQLIVGPLDRDIVTDFWTLSAAEIEREMFNRLESLDAGADCLPGGPITSHRPLWGKAIVSVKKIVRRLLAPYSSMLLQKQNALNRELVTFQLLNFLKFRHLEKRLEELEEKLADLPGGTGPGRLTPDGKRTADTR
ncbi:MAG TPA: hypothetical protein VLQ89_05135 [Candidatus Binatia bacterium]|nr:hypothetical protein [Candidatus Binatia bacterium]